jgi:UDP-N-acetylmuramyl tripeptide synthase
VTGTNGKTTISTLLRHLQADGSQWGLVGTVRYTWPPLHPFL